MLNVNKVTLIGRLGADPEIIEYDKDKKLLKLSLGTNDFKKNVHWHNVVVFGDKQIDFIKEHAKKGSSLYVEGELTYKVKDNVKYASVLVSQFHYVILLGENAEKSDKLDNDYNDDDIPF